MNKKNQQAEDSLPGMLAALDRARERARQTALLHGTKLVLSVDGKTVFVAPDDPRLLGPRKTG